MKNPRHLLWLLPCVGLILYMTAVEPYWLRVTRHVVTAEIRTPLKLVLLTDIHTQGLGRREKALIRLLEEERPDAILVAGDTIASGSDYSHVAEVYRTLFAPKGVWVVKGNWENALTWGQVGLGTSPPPSEREVDFYQSTGVRLLDNAAGELTQDIWIVGIDDFSRGRPNFEKAIAQVPAEAYKIALFHSPEYFDQVAGRVDLVLAGHTHGGQVRLPGLPPLYCPSGCGEYVQGWYQKKGTRLYISRGVGTSILPIRLNCRPEIAVFEIVPR